MSTSTIEIVQVEMEKSKSDFSEVIHHYTPEEVFKCMKGLLYKSSCGIVFDPKHHRLGANVSGEDLSAMDKCVMCQTVLS